MNLQYESHFDQICRTCMCKDDNLQFLSIYEVSSENQTMPIAELLAVTTPQLVIQPTDELPKTICDSCLCKLTELHQFQQMCLHSETHMRGVLEYGVEAKFTQVQEQSSSTTAVSANLDPSCIGPDPLLGADVTAEEIHNYLKLELSEKEVVPQGTDDKAITIETDASVKTEINSLAEVEAESALSDCDDKNNDLDDSDWEEMNCEPDAPKKPKINKKTKSNKRVKKEVNAGDKIKTSISDKIACPECGKKFVNMFRVNRHMSVHDVSTRPFPCSLCKYRFSTISFMQRHISEIHNSKKPTIASASSNPEGYKCDKCPRRFAQEVSLKTHNQTQCQESAETTTSEELLLTFTCDYCSKIFKSKKNYMRHVRTHKEVREQEGVDDKPYVCEFCHKAFQQSCTLKEHIRTHTGEQPFLCSECGKAFNSSSNMKQHLLRHAGVKRYECPECPKKFPCLSDLASHKAVHNKWKPHICDICSAAFGKPYQLKKHKMYHNGEKPHKCEYCEMRFVCADHMRRHMRTHTGEKPYKCKYCIRAFAQSNDLIKHLRSHLGENVYKCELCPRAFRMATELREHFAAHKNDDEETRQQNLSALMEEEEKLRITLPSVSSRRKKREPAPETFNSA